VDDGDADADDDDIDSDVGVGRSVQQYRPVGTTPMIDDEESYEEQCNRLTLVQTPRMQPCIGEGAERREMGMGMGIEVTEEEEEEEEEEA